MSKDLNAARAMRHNQALRTKYSNPKREPTESRATKGTTMTTTERCPASDLCRGDWIVIDGSEPMMVTQSPAMKHVVPDPIPDHPQPWPAVHILTTKRGYVRFPDEYVQRVIDLDPPEQRGFCAMPAGTCPVCSRGVCAAPAGTCPVCGNPEEQPT